MALREKAFCYVVQEYIVFSFVKKFTKYAYAYVIHKKAPPAQGGVAFIRMAPFSLHFLLKVSHFCMLINDFLSLLPKWVISDCSWSVGNVLRLCLCVYGY